MAATISKPGPKPVKTAKLDSIGIEAICARIADCEFLEVIAKDCEVSRYTLSRWLESGDNSTLYAHAREAQADKMAADILKIADDGENDTYKDEEGNRRTDQDVIARSRLRVDARKWLAAKMAPKKYGDKLDVDQKISGELALKRSASDYTDEELIAIATGKRV